MKHILTLRIQIAAARQHIVAIGSTICYDLQEKEEDLEIAKMLLEADNWLEKATKQLQKEVI